VTEPFAPLLGVDDAVALIDPVSGRSVSYAQLRSDVDRLAGQLRHAGVATGDTVAVSMPNGPQIITAFLAVVAAGAACAPLNPAYTREELAGYLTDLAPTLTLVADGSATVIAEACKAAAVTIRTAASFGSCAALDEPDGELVALLLHTSGTTSKPKLVPIRQRNLMASARTVADWYALSPADTSHCVMPLFHVHGLVASTLATLVSGGSVITPPRFGAQVFWEHTAVYRATWFSAVPTIHHILVTRDGDGAPRPPHALRFARSCSSALPAGLWGEFESRFGVALVEAYGMTEAAHQMASNPLPPGVRHPGTVGVATGTQIAILDDSWAHLPPGGVGEVAVRGPGVVDGYLDNPEANAASFRDGWFRTGDSGVLDDDGYLRLAGRIKELINRGGEKISPPEIEEALLAHAAVTEACAFAIPDAKYGEVVGAIVVLRSPASEAALRAHCAATLAAFKVPSRVFIADAIPKGATGKVQRRVMAGLVGAG
jgi:oxalate---CoA ligase